MDDLAHVYARSLFAVAHEQGKLDTVAEQLGQIDEALEASDDLRLFFFSPYFSSAEKREALPRLFVDAEPAIANLLDLLVANAFLDLVDVPAVLPGLLRLLVPGGYLVTCSCSYNVNEQMFEETLHQASFAQLRVQPVHRPMEGVFWYRFAPGDGPGGKRIQCSGMSYFDLFDSQFLADRVPQLVDHVKRGPMQRFVYQEGNAFLKIDHYLK